MKLPIAPSWRQTKSKFEWRRLVSVCGGGGGGWQAGDKKETRETFAFVELRITYIYLMVAEPQEEEVEQNYGSYSASRR